MRAKVPTIAPFPGGRHSRRREAFLVAKAHRVGGTRSAGANFVTANEYECCLGHHRRVTGADARPRGGMRVGAKFRRDQPPPDLDLAPGATSEDAVLMTGARARGAPLTASSPVGTLRFCSPDLPPPPSSSQLTPPFPCVRRSSPARDTVFSPRSISPRTPSSRDARTAAGCSP